MHLLHQEVFERAKYEELYAIRDRYQFRAPHIRYSAAGVREAKRPYFNLIEKKTKKKKRIDMTPALQREFKAYVEGKEDHEFLFKSREGINKPISRSMAYKILRAAAEYVGLDDIGTHTLRKTFGYHFYKQTKDVAMLQEIFNHSDQRTTLRYIGINQDAMNNAMKKFKI